MRELRRGPWTAGRRTRQRTGSWAMGFLAAIALIVALGWPAVTAQSARAEGRPPGGDLSDPLVRGVDIAAPAVVRVFAIYTAQISFSLCGKTVTLPGGGRSYTLGWSGTGAFISANGDILTAGHVVDDSKQSLDDGIFESVSSDIAALLDANLACLGLPAPLTPDDVANGAVQDLGIPYQTTTTKPDFDIFRSVSYSGPVSVGGSVTRLRDLINGVPHQQATVRAFSDFLKDDLAIVHVSLTDTPSIALDDSRQVAMQDKLTILGYPGNGDLPPELGGFNPTNLFTVSANTVTVSAIKQNANGSQLIQVGGNVEHGDSGGPALNTAGHVVGVVSFGGLDTPDGTSFFRATSSVQPLIGQASVDTKPGAFQTAWEQAFGDYAATYSGHWHKAAAELDALASKYPDFVGVQAYKAYADVAAGSEVVSLTSQTPDPRLLGGIAAGAVGLLLVLGTVVLVGNRRRAKAARAAAAAYGYPGYPPGDLSKGTAQSWNGAQSQGQARAPTPSPLQGTASLRERDR